MHKFEILPHTADVRLKITSDSLIGLYYAAVDGMNCILKNDYRQLRKTGERKSKIEVNSLDESMLLIDFLSQVLTLSHKNKACYRIEGIEILDNTRATAVITGFRTGGFDEDIKAVTYTEARIIRNELNLFETIIVFDI